MTETIYERINKTLTWKRILAFNFVLILVLIVPLSVKLSQQDTELRSNAAGEGAIIPSPTPLPNYPKAAPSIARVSTFYGKPGDSLVIIGDNLGDYQWASRVYVGNVAATKDDIVSWSNGIVEVRIPEQARTGEVMVEINGQRAIWDGKIVLYTANQSARVGMSKTSPTSANLWVERGDRIRSGIIEIAYVTEPVVINQAPGVVVNVQPASVDLLGKKVKVEFTVETVLSRSQTNLLTIEHPQVGAIELTQAQFFDEQGSLLEAYSDPLVVKLLP